jgi:multifunctional methyltransferase subunit TRM112
MKLLTHNMLTSPGNARGFPLKIVATTVEEVETEFNSEFVARMVSRLEWQALLGALRDLGVKHELPADIPDAFEEDENFLKALHHVLLEVGRAICSA